MRDQRRATILMILATAAAAASCVTGAPRDTEVDAGDSVGDPGGEPAARSNGVGAVGLDHQPAPTMTSGLLAPPDVRVAVIPFYYNSPVPSMNNPVAKPPAWSAVAPAWDILSVYFTGTGNSASTGSARGYWSQVSGGSVRVKGHVFPWTAVRNQGTPDLARNYRPLYLWFDSSLPEYSKYVTNGMCSRDWELDASNNPLSVPPRNLAADGKCLCRDVPEVSPHYVEAACGAPCPDHSPTPIAQLATAGAKWCRVAIEGGGNQIAAIQGSIPAGGVNVKDEAGASQFVTFNPASYDVIAYVYPESFPGQGGGSVTWASLSSRGYAFYNATHELGHTLRLTHSANRVCATGGISTSPTVTATGTAVTLDAEANCYAWLDQGDCCSGYGAYSVMGSADYSQQINGYQRLVASALEPAAMTTITTSGSYTLQRSTFGSGTRLLRVATQRGPAAAYHYLEYRTAATSTFDYNLPAGMIGVTVTMAPDYGTSGYPQLLDAHPGTFASFSDAAFKVGESFTDTVAGLVAQVAAADGTQATIDVSLRPTQTNLFSYRAATGDRWVHWQDAAGVRTLQQTVPGASTSWTHVAGCNGRGLLYYATATGAAWRAYLTPAGFPQSVGALTLPAGFTHVTCAGKGNLFLYNTSTGAYTTGRITSDGLFTQGASGTLDAGWTVVTGTVAGKLVFYGRPSGSLRLYRVDSITAGGALTTLTTGTTSAGYTIVAPVRDSGLLFYKAADGALHVATLDDQGRLTFVDTTGDTWSGYTDIVGGQNGSVTLYSSSLGYLDTTTVSPSFAVAAPTLGTAVGGMKLTGAGGF